MSNLAQNVSNGINLGVLNAIESLEYGKRYVISVRFIYKDSKSVNNTTYLLVQPDKDHFDIMKYCISEEIISMLLGGSCSSIKTRIREVC